MRSKLRSIGRALGWRRHFSVRNGAVATKHIFAATERLVFKLVKSDPRRSCRNNSRIRKGAPSAAR